MEILVFENPIKKEDMMSFLVQKVNDKLSLYHLVLDDMKSYKGYKRESMNLESLEKIRDRGNKFYEDPSSMIRVGIFEAPDYIRVHIYHLYFKTCVCLSMDSDKFDSYEIKKEKDVIANFNFDKSLRSGYDFKVTFLKK